MKFIGGSTDDYKEIFNKMGYNFGFGGSTRSTTDVGDMLNDITSDSYQILIIEE